jgi:hypothetical protein
MMEKGAGSSEQGGRRRKKGTGKREQGAGSREVVLLTRGQHLSPASPISAPTPLTCRPPPALDKLCGGAPVRSSAIIARSHNSR